MSEETSIVDKSSPDAVRAAIKYVNGTKGLRIQPGIEALWVLYRAPGHRMLHSELKKQFRALNTHFGWFCKYVAKELGDPTPGEFALCDHVTTDSGELSLKLKASVVAALSSRIPSK